MIPDDHRNGPKLYTVKEAANFLGCSERKLRGEISAGTITYRRPPEGIRFAEVDLLDRLRPKGGPGAKKGVKDSLMGVPVRRSPAPTSHTGNIRLVGTPIDMVWGCMVFIRFGDYRAEIAGQNVTS